MTICSSVTIGLRFISPLRFDFPPPRTEVHLALGTLPFGFWTVHLFLPVRQCTVRLAAFGNGSLAGDSGCSATSMIHGKGLWHSPAGLIHEIRFSSCASEMKICLFELSREQLECHETGPFDLLTHSVYNRLWCVLFAPYGCC